jgi:hypothetical protein
MMVWGYIFEIITIKIGILGEESNTVNITAIPVSCL